MSEEHSGSSSMQRIVHNRPGALARFPLSGAEESATGMGSAPKGGGAGFRAASLTGRH
jgi:hypothetical protein